MNYKVLRDELRSPGGEKFVQGDVVEGHRLSSDQQGLAYLLRNELIEEAEDAEVRIKLTGEGYDSLDVLLEKNTALNQMLEEKDAIIEAHIARKDLLIQEIRFLHTKHPEDYPNADIHDDYDPSEGYLAIVKDEQTKAAAADAKAAAKATK
jgi:hypothetical protein